ncbi:MAG: hypothetical protein FJW26_16800 [Acidimicrobiia bacterium]|nr:hypothetical protein [Acidimicrobiia bacterium]
MNAKSFACAMCVLVLLPTWLGAQTYGEADRSAPGDESIQTYLRREAERIEAGFGTGLGSRSEWERARQTYREEYFYMLGLSPFPEKTPLHATRTGTLVGDGFIVDMLHYQSRPGLYVTGNLYRPAVQKDGERLPAILYVCGHASRGRNGNKTAYQAHGIWFARHGYLCLVIDTLQLGEIEAVHHGTYREGRWWWYSRGYTPAGVECWNGIRGIDYLLSRPEVDPQRIAVTGISGGGAVTFWIAAADERVKIAAPVSGMADLASYVASRVINGHCDCMFFHNLYQWPWTRIAALIAPRPLFFVNSDHDAIFPMDANERVINRLERVYSLFGAGDDVDALVSIGGHAYRQDIRQAVYRFHNRSLKNEAGAVADSERDLVTGERNQERHPLDPEKLRVFPSDRELPKDQKNTTIDERFVPMATVELPKVGQFSQWKQHLFGKLRQFTFRYFPDTLAPARRLASAVPEAAGFETEPGIRVDVRTVARPAEGAPVRRVLLVLAGAKDGTVEAAKDWKKSDDVVMVCEPRGIGNTRWTVKNPPNYVERSHALLGRTVETGRVWDLAAVARGLAVERAPTPVYLVGEGASGILAAYAALWAPEVAGVMLDDPPSSHQEAAAPALLNVLRICDVPHLLGMLAPKPLWLRGGRAELREQLRAIYRAAGVAHAFN